MHRLLLHRATVINHITLKKPTCYYLLPLSSSTTPFKTTTTSNRSSFFNKTQQQQEIEQQQTEQQQQQKPFPATSGITSLQHGFQLLQQQNSKTSHVHIISNTSVTFEILSPKSLERVRITASTIPDDKETIQVYFPFGVPRTYKYCVKQQSWIGTEKGEDLFGLITRDLLPHVLGVPTFPKSV
jgi:hypothetical protein